MSNMLRNKQGNLSKVKYFLPGSRNPLAPTNHTEQPPPPKSQHRKKSCQNTHSRSLH